MRVALGPLEVENYFFQQRAQEFFAITIGGSCGAPDLSNIGAEPLDELELLRRQCAGPLLLPATELRLCGRQFAQTILPFAFQPTRDQSVFGLYISIPALSPLGFVTGAFHFQTPLRQRRVVISLQLLNCEERRLDSRRSNSFDKGIGDGLLDRQTTDIEAIHATSLDEIFAGTVITRSGVSTAIVRVQPPAAMAASGDALQQRRAFSHRASCLVWLWAGIGIESRLVGLKRGPIDETRVVLWNENGPLSNGKMAYPFPNDAVFVDIALSLIHI